MKKLLGFAAAAVLLSIPAYAQDENAEQGERGQTYQVADNIHVAVLENRNSVYLVSEDGVLVAETNFERNAQALADLIATVAANPVRLVVNTHWHGDHIGGNAFFAERGAVVLAHENTRIRMSAQQVNPVTGRVQLEPQLPEFLPTLTFQDKITIHWGDEVVDLVYHPNAHTDSDVVLYYRNANVIFVAGLMEYPTYAGVYSPEGFMAALDSVIAQSDEDTKIIPWQGPVVSRDELQEWRDIIATMSERVAALLAQGSTVDEIIAAQPSQDFDEKWGGGRSPERFARDMHYVLTNAR